MLMNFKKYFDFLQPGFGSVFNKRIWHGQPNIAHHQGVRDRKIEVGGHTKDPATVRLCQKLQPQRPKKLRKSRFFKGWVTGFISTRLWPRFQSFFNIWQAFAANPIMTITVVDRIDNTTKSKPFIMVFSLSQRIFFSKSPFLCKLLIGNFTGIFSGTDFAK